MVNDQRKDVLDARNALLVLYEAMCLIDVDAKCIGYEYDMFCYLLLMYSGHFSWLGQTAGMVCQGTNFG